MHVSGVHIERRKERQRKSCYKEQASSLLECGQEPTPPMEACKARTQDPLCYNPSFNMTYSRPRKKQEKHLCSLTVWPSVSDVSLNGANIILVQSGCMAFWVRFQLRMELTSSVRKAFQLHCFAKASCTCYARGGVQHTLTLTHEQAQTHKFNSFSAFQPDVRTHLCHSLPRKRCERCNVQNVLKAFRVGRPHRFLVSISLVRLIPKTVSHEMQRILKMTYISRFPL